MEVAGPLGTPLGLAQRKRASPRGEAGTSGFLCVPPPSPFHPSGSSQCTSPEHPVSCIKPGLATLFIHDILHVSMPFSQIFPPSPSLTESIRLFYTSVSLLLSRTQGYCYHLSKFHIYALVYCIGVFLSGLLEWVAMPSSMASTNPRDRTQVSCSAGDPSSIPGLGRVPGEGNGYPLQYSCLEKSMDRGAWQATDHGVSKT